MFNNIIKEEWIEYFLNTVSMSKNSIKNIFNLSERFEELADNGKGKDICNFTPPEIENFYKSMGAESKERIAVTNSILKSYKDWCIGRNDGLCFDTINYFDTFSIENFKNYISKGVLENKFIGYETLQHYVNELINPCDQLLLVLLYNGIKGKQLFEIINLNVNQIDGNILHLATGRDVEVDDYVIDLIRETNEVYDYYAYSDKSENAKIWRMTGENVMKEVKSARSDSLDSIYHRYSMKLAKFQKMFDNPELSINRIWRSGMLDTLIKKAEKMNMNMDEFVSSDYAKPILEKYQFNQHPSKIIKIFSEYFEYIK